MRKTIIAMVLLAAACHGKQASTTPDDGEEHTAPVPKGEGPDYRADPNQISGDKLDEVNRLLERRRPAVSRCLAFVVDNKDLPRNSKGRMTLEIKIETSGKVSEVKVQNDALNSKPLEDCVINKVKEIAFPQLPKPLETSYAYGFEAI